MKINKLTKILVFFLSFLFLFSFVYADGGLFIKLYDNDLKRDIVKLNNQQQQVGIITYKKGIENLTIIVTPENQDFKQAVWIFPIPSTPEKTNIYIVDDFPKFRGDYFDTYIKDSFDSFKLEFYLNFLFIIPFFPYILEKENILTEFLYTPVSGAAKSYSATEFPSLEIHKTVIKDGLTVQLITSKDGNVLYEYLKSIGFELDYSIKEQFNYYIGKDYSFVVSWFNLENSSNDLNNSLNYNKFRGKKVLGISVTFPTKKLYYPLKITSVYENYIPIKIYVKGHVSPELYLLIKESTSVEYYELFSPIQ
ncbi:MAG: hypothetical protein QXU20_00870 [Candidatus Woesearchaeota archaeon]